MNLFLYFKMLIEIIVLYQLIFSIYIEKLLLSTIILGFYR